MGIFDRLIREMGKGANEQMLREAQQELLREILTDWIENEFDLAKQMLNEQEPIDNVFAKISEVEFLINKCEFALPSSMKSSMTLFLDKQREDIKQFVDNELNYSKLVSAKQRNDAFIFLAEYDPSDITVDNLYGNLTQLPSIIDLDIEKGILYDTLNCKGTLTDRQLESTKNYFKNIIHNNITDAYYWVIEFISGKNNKNEQHKLGQPFNTVELIALKNMLDCLY